MQQTPARPTPGRPGPLMTPGSPMTPGPPTPGLSMSPGPPTPGLSMSPGPPTPYGPPGTPGYPGQPQGPGSPFTFQRTSGPQALEPQRLFGSYDSGQKPSEGAGDDRKKNKKKRKSKRRDSDTEYDSEDSSYSCECQPGQPTTQIFIAQGGGQPCPRPGFDQNYNDAEGECPSCLTWDQWCQQYCPANGSKSMGNSRPPMDCTQLIPCLPCCSPQKSRKKTKHKSKNCCLPMCAPPTHCTCCRCQEKEKEAKNECCCCGSSPSKGGKPKSSLEGMMPATQQFLMFLQAYGLAATLIKDRCNRAAASQQGGPNQPECPPCPPCPKPKGEPKPKVKRNTA